MGLIFDSKEEKFLKQLKEIVTNLENDKDIKLNDGQKSEVDFLIIRLQQAADYSHTIAEQESGGGSALMSGIKTGAAIAAGVAGVAGLAGAAYMAKESGLAGLGKIMSKKDDKTDESKIGKLLDNLF